LIRHFIVVRSRAEPSPEAVMRIRADPATFAAIILLVMAVAFALLLILFGVRFHARAAGCDGSWQRYSLPPAIIGPPLPIRSLFLIAAALLGELRYRHTA
jgi:hypothetical protein